VPADRLENALNSVAALAPDADVRIALRDKTLTVSAPRMRYSMPTLPADALPMPVWTEDTKPIREWSALASAFMFALPCALLKEINRPFLNGVAVKAGDVVASDGHRAAMTRGLGELEDMIVPTPSVTALASIQGATAYGRKDGTLVVHFPDGSFSVQLVAHDYPDMKRVIPPEHYEHKILVDREFLKRALGAMRKSGLAPCLRISMTTDLLTLDDEGQDGGSRVEVPCTYTGPEWTGTFNAAYVGAAVDGLEGKEVTISWVPKSMKPMLLSGEKAHRCVVVMPWKD
jgi:DNA polymerase III sliding clamp (beta) subunit (PCNA family)